MLRGGLDGKNALPCAKTRDKADPGMCKGNREKVRHARQNWACDQPPVTNLCEQVSAQHPSLSLVERGVWEV